MIDNFHDFPLVAILRGVVPEKIAGVASVLSGAGIRAIEVPLNSPEPYKSIKILTESCGRTCLTGAGTVLDPLDVDRVADAGGKLIVTPNTNEAVIERAVKNDMIVMAGFYTPTEAFAALAAGAHALKLFPASTGGTAHLAALLAVLPKQVPVYVVGGVGVANMQAWRHAGAAGFGIGSELFKPDFDENEIALRAGKIVAAFKAAG